MTTHWRQKASSILVLALMLLLLIIVISLCTAVSNGLFSTNRSTTSNRINISENSTIDHHSHQNWDRGEFYAKVLVMLLFVRWR